MAKAPHPKGVIRSLLKSNLTKNEKMVLTVLWAHSNDNGECWPSVDIIAKGAGLDRRTVFRCLAELRTNSLVETYENSKGKTNVYKIRYDKINSDTQSRVSRSHGCHSVTNKGDTRPPMGDTRPPEQCHSVTGGVTNRDCIYKEEVPNEVSHEETIEREKTKNSKNPPTAPQSEEDELDKKIDEYLAEFETLWLSWDKTITLEKHLENILSKVEVHYSTPWCMCNSALNRTKAEIEKAFTDSLKKRRNAGETLNEWEIHVLNGVEWAVFQYLDPHNQNINRIFEGKNPMEGYEAFQPYYDSAIYKAYEKARELWMYRKLRRS